MGALNSVPRLFSGDIDIPHDQEDGLSDSLQPLTGKITHAKPNHFDGPIRHEIDSPVVSAGTKQVLHPTLSSAIR